MQLFIGLGNPGEKYNNTRHNVGFMVIDELASQVGDGNWVSDKNSSSLIAKNASFSIFAKPQTFMNSSGLAVQSLVNYLKLEGPKVWVIYDDLDIKLGQFKIQFARGPKDHNGLLSIYEKLGTKKFWHVRVGVENRATNAQGDFGQTRKISGEEYVLGKFANDERDILKGVVFKIINEIKQKLTI